MKKRITLYFIIFCAFINGACNSAENRVTASIPPAAPIISDKSSNEKEIRFYENKIKNDAEDFSANNKLAGLYLQKLRETGDVTLLNLAFRAARTSLDSVPDVRNSGGLAALALAEFASHEFSKARGHAVRLIELEPTKSYPQGILGDALLELGEYEKAEIAYKKITLLDNGSSSGSKARLARLAQLKGDNEQAQKHFATALTLALRSIAAATRHCRVAAAITRRRRNIFRIPGKINEAQTAIKDALQLGTNDAKLFYHAGIIKKVSGNNKNAVDFLQKALKLNPSFDILQAQTAKAALQKLN